MELASYLGFGGDCAEAFGFYERSLGGTILRMLTYGDSPLAAATPPERQGAVLHARMALGRSLLMGGDVPAGEARPMSGAVALLLPGVAAVERAFAALAEGGTVRMPLAETFFSPRFGMLTDRFGTPWMIACEAPPGPTEVALSRHIAATPARVFAAWAEPARFARWWGPQGFTNRIEHIEVRPGGRIRLVMVAPDGAEHPMSGVFHEVVAHERLVFSAIARDGAGAPLLEACTEVTFAPEAGGTRITVRARAEGFVPLAGAMLAGMEAGWAGSLDRLAAVAGESRG